MEFSILHLVLVTLNYIYILYYLCSNSTYSPRLSTEHLHAQTIDHGGNRLREDIGDQLFVVVFVVNNFHLIDVGGLEMKISQQESIVPLNSQNGPTGCTQLTDSTEFHLRINHPQNQTSNGQGAGCALNHLPINITQNIDHHCGHSNSVDHRHTLCNSPCLHAN